MDKHHATAPTARPHRGGAPEAGALEDDRVLSPTRQHLLDLLADRPRRGADLARLLNISRQGVRAAILTLIRSGRIRVGDPDRVTLIVAHRDDPTILLTSADERLLSALTEGMEAAAAAIARAANMPLAEVEPRLASLIATKLLLRVDHFSRGFRYRLSPAGVRHPQYRREAPKATPASLGVKSDRICNALSCLADHGPKRTRDIANLLHVERHSMNALMQYLKRKALVRKIADGHHDGFVLTPEGQAVQQQMRRLRD